MAYQTPQGISA